MISPAKLEEWKGLADRATPGPWVHLWVRADQQALFTTPGNEIRLDGGGHFLPYDATFIAAARTAVPALIAEVERLREALTKAAEQFEFYAREHRNKATDQTSGVAAVTLAKAETNERFAAMCRAALTEQSNG
jgi:hypothetical protein